VANVTKHLRACYLSYPGDENPLQYYIPVQGRISGADGVCSLLPSGVISSVPVCDTGSPIAIPGETAKQITAKTVCHLPRDSEPNPRLKSGARTPPELESRPLKFL